MPNLPAIRPSKKSMLLLSHLLLSPNSWRTSSPRMTGLLESQIANISREDFQELVALASSNHVVVRGLEAFLDMVRTAEAASRAAWAETALAVERARIQNALPFLHAICAAFEVAGSDITVIKSLDHWPDLGSDLDLYTNADSVSVLDLMKKRFQAQVAHRSWGDRLAHKWNFLIPGLPEAVEIHVGRLGQTGEQVALAASLAARARSVQIDGRSFRVPAISDRLMISTLQRMYRHFYFRLCDIVDSAGLVESGAVDYKDLQRSADEAGIWEGVATYLLIVSDYVKQHRGWGLDLPPAVRAAARFGGDEVYYAREFLRIPILPQSASLYGSQLTGLLRRWELQNSARLGLLPWLATAAAVGQKITGSDKGIW
jgi:hypothetical protein